MDNLLNIISKEDPKKLLKSTFEEISNRLKYKLGLENIVFIYEVNREILRSLSSTLLNIDQIRIHLTNDDELKINYLQDRRRSINSLQKILMQVILVARSYLSIYTRSS